MRVPRREGESETGVVGVPADSVPAVPCNESTARNFATMATASAARIMWMATVRANVVAYVLPYVRP